MNQPYSFLKQRLFLTMIFLMIIVSGYSQTVTGSVNNVSVTITSPANLQTCANNMLNVVIHNERGVVVNNFDLTFLNNTGLDILYADLVNTNITNDAPNNKITINALQIGEVFSFNIPFRASCSNLNNSTNTTTLGYLTIRPASDPSADLFFSFSISSGNLTYITATNTVYTGYKNDPAFVRRYIMKNSSGNSYTGIVSIEEDVPDNISLSNINLVVGGVTVNTIATPVVDPATKKMIYTFSLTNVGSQQEVEINETVSLIGCPIDESKSIILKDGCSGDLCHPIIGGGIANFEVTINKGPNVPNISIVEIEPKDFSNCLPDNTNIIRKFRLRNTGSTAFNIRIPYYSSLLNDNMNLMLVPNSSFVVTPGNSSINVSLTSEEIYTIDYIENEMLGSNRKVKYIDCFSSETEIIKSKSYTIDRLLQGDSIDFEYSQKLCCVSKGLTTSFITDDGFGSPVYDDGCVADKTAPGRTTSDAGYVNQGVSQIATTGVSNMFGCKDCGGAPGCFGNPTGNCDNTTLNQGLDIKSDFTENIILKNSGVNIINIPMDLHSFRIVVDVAADGRLMLAPQNYPGATAQTGNIRLRDSHGRIYTPAIQNVLSNATITDLFKTTDFPVTPDNYSGARVFFEFSQTDINNIFLAGNVISYDQNGYKSIDYYRLSKFINSLEVLFELSGKCDRSPINAGPSNYFERISIQPNSSCSDCLLPIGEFSKVIIVNCPGCVLPGMLTSAYDVERVTIGENDGDNNGIPDGINIVSGATVNNGANLKMVTDNDIFKTTTNSIFWGGSIATYGSGSTYGSVEEQTGFAHRFLNNMGRLDIFTSNGSAFGAIIDAAHPITVKYFRNGNSLFTATFNNNNNNIYSANGTGNFLFQFPVTLMRAQSGDPNFNYEAGDNFEITCFYKVNAGFDLGPSNFYKNVDVATRVFFSGNQDPNVVIVKDLNATSDSDPASPYGISGGITDPALLLPTMNYICEASGGGFLLADLKEGFNYGYGSNWYDDGPCYKVSGMSYGVSTNVENRQRIYTQLDLFPFEVRNFSRSNAFNVVVPKGYMLDLHNSQITSSFSHRNADDYDYIQYTQKATLDQGADVTLVNSNYSDPANNLYGKLYKVSFNFDSQNRYFSNSFHDQYYPIGIGNFKYYNEYVDQTMSVVLVPDCNDSDLSNIAFIDSSIPSEPNWYSTHGYKIYPGFNASVSRFDDVSNDYGAPSVVKKYDEVAGFTSVTGGDIKLVLTQSPTFISKKTQKIPFKINLDLSNDKVFLYFTNDNNGQFQFGQLRNVTTNTIVPLGATTNVYELGHLDGGVYTDFEIETSYICNGGNNSEVNLIAHFGYDCSQYPTFDGVQLDRTPCKLKVDSLGIQLKSANTEIQYNTINGNVPCEEIIHTVKISPLGLGNIYIDQNTGADVVVTLPSEISYIAGSTVLTAYNNDGTIMQSSSAQNIQYSLPDNLLSKVGNVYSWSIAGYPELENIDINTITGYYVLSFKTDPSCRFTGGPVNATVNTVSYCLDNLSKSLSPAYNIVFNENCSPIDLSLTAPAQWCKGSELTNFEYTITDRPGSGADTYHLSWVINSVQVASENVTINAYPYTYNGSKQLNLNGYTGLANVQLTITSSLGCIASKQVVVTVNPKPTIDFTLPSEYCFGNSAIQLVGNPTGGIFKEPAITGNQSITQFSTTVAGVHTIRYIYTDPSTTCSDSTSRTIVASQCCKYALGHAVIPCDMNETFCLPIKAVRTVNNGIIGMDFTLRYDFTKMEPTGNYTIGGVVANGAITTDMAACALNRNQNIPANPGSNNKLVHGSIFYKGSAPANAQFAGTGDVICIEFRMKVTSTPGTTYTIAGGDMLLNTTPNPDVLEFKQGYIDEDYKLSTVRACMDDDTGAVRIIRNTKLNGKIIFHNQINDVLKYDPLNPSTYLVTNIKATNGCVLMGNIGVVPDLNGNFSIDMAGANGLKVTRDIAGDYYSAPICTDPGAVLEGSMHPILGAINGYDSYLIESISTLRKPSDVLYVSDRKVPGAKTPGYATGRFPTAFQMIAADVNMGNTIRANDITLVQQRAVALICEYPQVWNYNIGADPNKYPLNGIRSLDWRFVSDTSGTDFMRSGNYPNPPTSAGKYWREDVPEVPSCINAPAASGISCKAYADKNIYAILLGDLDGSWRGNTAAQFYMKEAMTRSVILDYKNMQHTGTSTYRIPVKFSSDGQTVSVDFALDYDETKIRVTQVGKLAAATDADSRMMYNDYNSKELFLTSYTMTGFGSSNLLYYIDVTSMDGTMQPQYLGSGEGYLNGQRVALVMEGVSVTGTLDQLGADGYGFEVVPNPVTGAGSIIYNLKTDDNARIVVYNAVGQIVQEYNTVKGSGSIEVNAADLAAGMYQVILYKGESDRLAKKMVIQK